MTESDSATPQSKASHGVAARRLVRRLSAWAWDETLFDVGRVEWKYGRNDNGQPKNWTEWNNVRVHLREAGKLRQPQELDSTNAIAEPPRTNE